MPIVALQRSAGMQIGADLFKTPTSQIRAWVGFTALLHRIDDDEAHGLGQRGELDDIILASEQDGSAALMIRLSLVGKTSASREQ
jgi:hypothetical protein